MNSLRITRFLLSLLYEQTFIKLNSSLFDHPDHFEFVKISGLPDSSDTPNFQRGFKIFEDSAYEGDFENVNILKERDGDNLGDGGIRGIQIFRNSQFTKWGIPLKKFSFSFNMRIWGIPLMKFSFSFNMRIWGIPLMKFSFSFTFPFPVTLRKMKS